MVGDILGDIVVGDIVGDIVQVATFQKRFCRVLDYARQAGQNVGMWSKRPHFVSERELRA